MTSTTLTNLSDDAGEPRPLLSPRAWGWIIAIGGAFVLVHWLFIWKTARIYLSDNASVRNDWSHVVAIPIIAGFYVYQKREELKKIAPSISWWGLPILFAGLFSYVFWIYPGRNDMFLGYSVVLSLFGLLLLLLGPRMMRILWFPVLYLVFMVRVSERLWERIANVLQDIAARGSGFILQVCSSFMDFDIDTTGNTIRLSNQTLLSLYEAGQIASYPYAMNVAEACSGLRMLMAFIALGVAMAFMFDRPMWQRLVMVGMTIPVALMINIGRVTAIGLIALKNPEMSQGDFHTFVGMLMLIPAAGLFWVLGWVMDRIIIQTPEDKRRRKEEAEAKLITRPATGDPTPRTFSNGAIVSGVLVGLGLIVATGLLYGAMIGIPAISDAMMSLGVALGLKSAPAAMLSVVVRVAIIVFLVICLLPLLRRVVGGYGRPAIMLMVAVLLGGWFFTQYGVLKAQDAVLIKAAVPLRHKLHYVAPVTNYIGPWEVVFREPRLQAEVEDALGTKDYLSWYLLDTRMARPEKIDLRRRDFPTGAVMRLHLAYYTGGIGTVPHVPERCNVAGGFQAIGNPFSVSLDIDNGQYTFDPELERYDTDAQLEPTVAAPSTTVPARAFSYAPPSRPEASETVVYFFIANGQFYASPDEVRMLGFDLKAKHAYHFKVQVEMLRSYGELADRSDDKDLSDKEKQERREQMAIERTEALLQDIMPEILAALPDWAEVQAGRYPVSPDQGQTPTQPTD